MADYKVFDNNDDNIHLIKAQIFKKISEKFFQEYSLVHNIYVLKRLHQSFRHVHFCKRDFEKLFVEGKELTFLKTLSQPGQFVAKERVNIIGFKGCIENVAILGPFRNQTQVEVYLSDIERLELKA